MDKMISPHNGSCLFSLIDCPNAIPRTKAGARTATNCIFSITSFNKPDLNEVGTNKPK